MSRLNLFGETLNPCQMIQQRSWTFGDRRLQITTGRTASHCWLIRRDTTTLRRRRRRRFSSMFSLDRWFLDFHWTRTRAFRGLRGVLQICIMMSSESTFSLDWWMDILVLITGTLPFCFIVRVFVVNCWGFLRAVSFTVDDDWKFRRDSSESRPRWSKAEGLVFIYLERWACFEEVPHIDRSLCSFDRRVSWRPTVWAESSLVTIDVEWPSCVFWIERGKHRIDSRKPLKAREFYVLSLRSYPLYERLSNRQGIEQLFYGDDSFVVLLSTGEVQSTIGICCSTSIMMMI